MKLAFFETLFMAGVSLPLLKQRIQYAVDFYHKGVHIIHNDYGIPAPWDSVAFGFLTLIVVYIGKKFLGLFRRKQPIEQRFRIN